LVSFNDYPLGDPNASAPSGGSGNDKGGSATGNIGNTGDVGTGNVGNVGVGNTGNVGAQDAGGSTSTAGTSPQTGGKETGGTETGGTNAMPMGGAGASDAGGETGEGGEPAALGNQNLVDDFEDGDASILELQGRSGVWLASNDGRGQQTPKNGENVMPSALDLVNGASTRAIHTWGSGSGFTTWGAMVGTALATSGGKAVAYDLSGHRGLRFWVRSGSTSIYAAKAVRLNFPTTASSSGCTMCGDHPGVDVPLTSKWVHIDVPLSTLKQQGWGRPRIPTPDVTQTLGIQFLFATGAAFDLWVDDLELY
jgi:hypothetical protein